MGFNIKIGLQRAPQVVLVVKNLPFNAQDLKDAGSILGLGRSPGEGNGNPLQYSCLENPMDRGTWRATVRRVATNRTWLIWLHMHTQESTWRESHAPGTGKKAHSLWCLFLNLSFESHLRMYIGSPGGLAVKNLTANARDLGLIPELGRSHGEGNGNPLQHYCLGNPTDRGDRWATVHGVAGESDMT